MIKSSNGDEYNCLEMESLFANANTLIPILGEVKYLSKIPVFTSAVQKIATLALSAKDIIEKIQNLDFNINLKTELETLGNQEIKEFEDFIEDFETIRSLLNGLLGWENNEGENSLENIYVEIAHDCRVHIINCISEKFAKMISTKVTGKVNSLKF